MCDRCGRISALPNPSVQLVPQVLYWGQIWTIWWPVQWYNVIVCQEILTNSSNMWSGLSCCRIRWRCCTRGTATGRRISSLYPTAVIFPSTTINWDFTPWAIPPQTITEPPPNLLVNSIQRRIRAATAARGGHTRYW